MYSVIFLKDGKHAVPGIPSLPQVTVVKGQVFSVPDQLHELIAQFAIRHKLAKMQVSDIKSDLEPPPPSKTVGTPPPPPSLDEE